MPITSEELFLIWFYSAVLFIVVLPIFTLIIHWGVPSGLLGKYFREPYFNKNELILLKSLPLAFYRTMAFSRAIVFPSSMKKRRMQKVREEAPRWYVNLNVAYVYWFVLHSSLVVFLLVGLGGYLYFFT